MLRFLDKFFTKNMGLKLTALILTLVLWFYVVGELNKGGEEERQFLKKILPPEGMAAKKLSIRPIFVGHPRQGYVVDNKNVTISPDYCIVVGSKELVGKIRFVYTMPIDVTAASKSFIKSVALNPIAPGVFMEETLVQVNVPVERESR